MSQPRDRRGRNRLNVEQQAAVVTRYSNGQTSTALAEEYSVAKSTIVRVLREARWSCAVSPSRPSR
ncbi:helix-turn-helix domain-containing protein [Microbacterium sp. SCN 69-37]|uniref:helix-turn-helix domain-containing protein n=1 Tax=Microbacterium sp. SCN 69-37 TaxID=1660115 RepID=UPI003412AF4C